MVVNYYKLKKHIVLKTELKKKIGGFLQDGMGLDEAVVIILKLNSSTLENAKKIINMLLETGDFENPETAYNTSMNVISDIDEIINLTN